MASDRGSRWPLVLRTASPLQPLFSSGVSVILRLKPIPTVKASKMRSLAVVVVVTSSWLHVATYRHAYHAAAGGDGVGAPPLIMLCSTT
ncbi:hypothetical protein OPV22_004769 [Ensete ventricosum]|uniref:Uncharacterized protein n=1 Tax=Ensete ventricosum TaxID=4639 RepID=A0AAV8RF39_ENSVE|nr:hypothetical protein OPV22_004769 [Ensete ventricosum]